MALRSAPPGFNSTLVQLKVHYPSSIYLRKRCFNSTLVQLKVVNIYSFFKRKNSFNSTLVQLKAQTLGFSVEARTVSILP